MDYTKISTVLFLLIASVSGRGIYSNQGSNLKLYEAIEELAKEDYNYMAIPGANNHDLSRRDQKQQTESDEYDEQELISQNQDQQEGINGFYDQDQEEDQNQQQEYDNQQQRDEQESIEKNTTNNKRSENSFAVMPLDKSSPQLSNDKLQPEEGKVKPEITDNKRQKDDKTDRVPPETGTDNIQNNHAQLFLVDDKEEGIDGVIKHSSIDKKETPKIEPIDLEHGGQFDSQQVEMEAKDNNQNTAFTSGPQDIGKPLNSQKSNEDKIVGKIPQTTTECTEEKEGQITQGFTNIDNEKEDKKNSDQSTSKNSELHSQHTIENKSTTPTIIVGNDDMTVDIDSHFPEEGITIATEVRKDSSVLDSGNHQIENKEKDESGIMTSQHTNNEDKTDNQHTTDDTPIQDNKTTVSLNQKKYEENIEKVSEQSTTVCSTTKEDKEVDHDDSAVHDSKHLDNGEKEKDSFERSTTVSIGNKYDSVSLDSQNTKKEIENDDKFDENKIIESQNPGKEVKALETTQSDKSNSSVSKIDVTGEPNHSTVSIPTTEKNEVSTVEHVRPHVNPNGPWNIPNGPWDHPHRPPRPWGRPHGQWGQDDDRWGYDEYGPWNHNRPWGYPRSQEQFRPGGYHNYHNNGRHDFPSKGGR